MSAGVLMVGNSHLAALRNAWRDDPGRLESVTPVWAGFLRDTLSETAVHDGQIVASGSGGARALSQFGHGEGIDLSAIDALVISGCQVSMFNIVRLHRQARYLSLPSLLFEEDIAVMEPMLMSRSGWELMATDAMLAVQGMCFAARVRQAKPDLPILYVPQPHPKQGSLVATDRKMLGFQQIAKTGDMPAMAAQFKHRVAAACDALALVHLPQPPETVTGSAMTRHSYMRGSLRLSGDGTQEHPEDDLLHANARYGALVLDQIVEELDAA